MGGGEERGPSNALSKAASWAWLLSQDRLLISATLHLRVCKIVVWVAGRVTAATSLGAGSFPDRGRRQGGQELDVFLPKVKCPSEGWREPSSRLRATSSLAATCRTLVQSWGARANRGAAGVGRVRTLAILRGLWGTPSISRPALSLLRSGRADTTGLTSSLGASLLPPRGHAGKTAWLSPVT